MKQVNRLGKEVTFNHAEDAFLKLKSFKEKLGVNFPRFGILVLTYNASELIEKTLSRIPEELWEYITEVFVFDDCSPDDTYGVLKTIKESHPHQEKIHITRNQTNQHYGGNQKLGYSHALKNGIDYTVMLHGDGQYAPEYLPDFFVAALEENAEVVFASRMVNKKDAISGGMPLYKWVGNQVLTQFENVVLNTQLSEFHSGYRMYSSDVLRKIPFKQNTNEFHFDTEIIVQCRALNVNIHEIPINTFYGDEECNVDGIKYAKDVCKSVLSYRLHQLHLLRDPKFALDFNVVYQRKHSPFSSHEMICKMVKSESKVLEVRGKNRILSEDLKRKGSQVDSYFILNHYDNFDQIPIMDNQYDFILLSDVFHYVKDGVNLLDHLKKALKPGGKMIISVSNIAIWYYRLSLLLGRFDYKDKGPLDFHHLRFFTLKSIKATLRNANLEVESIKYTNIPFELAFESIGKSKMIKAMDFFYRGFVLLWKKLFAYQFVIEVSCPSGD
jgi:glycosyltransferase involved in cell wall biosynthesis